MEMVVTTQRTQTMEIGTILNRQGQGRHYSWVFYDMEHVKKQFNGLMTDCSISTANTLEIPQFSTKALKLVSLWDITYYEVHEYDSHTYECEE